MADVANPHAPGLVRAIGRWSLAALVINSIIGSGLFGLPSVVAGYLGSISPWACAVAAAGIGVIMACFAEVSSRFTAPGGSYLYARAAFGPLVGLQMAWLSWLVRLTSAAANANLFVIYAGEFWPQITHALPRTIVLTLLLGMLALINIRGVGAGARLSNVFAVAKLLPLFMVVAGGAWYLLLSGRAPQLPLAVGTPSPSTAAWGDAILVLMFGYGGFEAALMPMGEARDPRRDAPFALLIALGVCTVLFTSIQWVVVNTLPDAAHAARPLAATANVFMGRPGAFIIATGALVSIYGYLAAAMLNTPRLTFALAENGEFPAFFGWTHARFRTPYASIAIFAVLLWALTLAAGFKWNVVLSAVARLFTYGLVCAALVVFRWKERVGKAGAKFGREASGLKMEEVKMDEVKMKEVKMKEVGIEDSARDLGARPGAALFRLRGGMLWAVAGVAFCGLIAARMGRIEFAFIAATLLLALANWTWSRGRRDVV